jgi:hypothetical protein
VSIKRGYLQPDPKATLSEMLQLGPKPTFGDNREQPRKTE